MEEEIIYERLRFAYQRPVDAETAVFSASVPDNKIRNIVLLLISGTPKSNDTVTFEKFVPATSTVSTILTVPAASGVTILHQIPETYHVKDPIIVLEGGTNLLTTTGATSGDLYLTVVYWDNDV